MFTGIIQNVVTVLNFESSAEGARLKIENPYRDVELGESIAINGVCLTVAEQIASKEMNFFLSIETLRRSNLSDLSPGGRVNLERAMLPTTRLSGHWVQGHVDGLARLIAAEPIGESFHLEFEIDPLMCRYCVEKGSISLNGVSLTLNQVDENHLHVNLIPYTWNHTNLSLIKPGDYVNVEVDILAKYVERLCQPYPKP